MAESLERYLTRTWEEPFEWGKRDCTLWPANWWVARYGEDPAAPYRGRYSTREEADALTGSDLIATIDGCIFQHRRKTPRRGDIGVVEVIGKELAAIFTGSHWAIKTEAKMLLIKREPKAIWGK